MLTAGVKNGGVTNQGKTQILQVRKRLTPRSGFVFIYGNTVAATALSHHSSYRRQGVLINEHLDYNTPTDDLSSRALTALGAVLSNFYANIGLGIATFKKLYDACIIKVSDCGAGVLGLGLYPKHDDLHNRALRFYLGVHKY